MPKVHLLLKKEEIDERRITENKIVVIFDILLATSTITSALENGAKSVIPVLNGEDAHKVASELNEESLLVGEYRGKTIDGFLAPNPTALKEKIASKTMIISTTNGTVALKKSKDAKRTYAASILNSQAVVEHLLHYHQEETILLVCSGSSDQFNVEDFYGTGYFIDCLCNSSSQVELELTDSAYASHLFYQSYHSKALDVLLQSRVGKKLVQYGYEKEIAYISQKSIYSVVPLFVDHQIIDATKARV